MLKMRLNQTMPDWMTKGIFYYLNSLTVPWKDDVAAAQLDIDYHGGHSGLKKVSPLVDNMLTDMGTLNDATRAQLAGVAVSVFSDRWNRIRSYRYSITLFIIMIWPRLKLSLELIMALRPTRAQTLARDHIQR